MSGWKRNIRDTTIIQRIIRNYYKQLLHANTSEDFQEMDRFLDTYQLPKLRHEARENLNKPVIKTGIKSGIKFLPTNFEENDKINFEENDKTWKKEIEDLKKWRNIPCSWMGRTASSKCLYYPQNNRQIQSDSNQNPKSILHKAGKSDAIHCIWRPQISKTVLKKKNLAEGIPVPDLRTCFRAVVI